MGAAEINDVLVLGITVAGLIGAWLKWGRRWWVKWRAPYRERAEQRNAMYARFGGVADTVDEMKDGVGRLTGQMRAATTTLGEHGKMLGTLRARSQSVYEASMNAEFECDPDGRWTSVNDKCAELLRVNDKGELLGFRFRSFIPADELQSFIARCRAAADDHRKFEDEITMRCADGELLRVRIHMIPHPPEAGPATHWTGVIKLVGA